MSYWATSHNHSENFWLLIHHLMTNKSEKLAYDDQLNTIPPMTISIFPCWSDITHDKTTVTIKLPRDQFQWKDLYRCFLHEWSDPRNFLSFASIRKFLSALIFLFILICFISCYIRNIWTKQCLEVTIKRNSITFVLNSFLLWDESCLTNWNLCHRHFSLVRQALFVRIKCSILFLVFTDSEKKLG